MTTVIQLAIVLGIMVLVHEFGHFIVAKLCGIRVEVFSIGFGKRLIGFNRGGTEYQIAAIPLGGYVKMSGELAGSGTDLHQDAAAADDPGSFSNHPRWQRMLVAFAGPIANFLLAFALMIGVGMLHNEVQQYLSAPAQTDYVPANTQVARTGIESGDTIVRYDTVNDPTWDQVAVRSMLNLNQNIDFSYVHDGHRVNTKLFVEDKNGPDNFSLDQLGLIPIMQTTPVEVDSLEANMPAVHAGLKSGDKITAIDGLRLHSVPAILAYLQDQAGKPATLTVLRTNPNKTTETAEINITPQLADAGDGTKEYRLGFSYFPPPVKVERLPFDKAVAASWKFNKKGSYLIVEVIERLFTRQVSVKSLSSPIGIGQQIHQAAEMPGWMPLIGLMAYISLNLGIFNLLPIPILDGGMIMFLVIESVMRRDVNQQFKERVYQVAFVCLLAFFAFVIFNDITKLGFFTKMKP